MSTAKDFEGRALTRNVCREAQAVVDQLRAHAHRLGQYTIIWDEGQNVRAYYGESGQALANAESIKTLINHTLFIRSGFFTQVETDLLAIR